MNYKTNKLPKSLIEIEVNLGEEEMEKFWLEAKKALANEQRLEKAIGERGKNLPEEGSGKSVDEKSLTIAVSESYLQVVKEIKEDLIGQPEVRVMKFIPKKELTYSVKVAVVPEIKLSDYASIAKEVFSREEKADVSEEEVDSALDWIRKSRIKVKELDKKAEIGDFVGIEYDVFDENGKKAFNGKDFFELGKGKYLLDFEKKIVGLGKGEEKKFELVIPKGFWENDWQGKKMKFSVRLNSVGEKVEPKLDDELAKSLGNFASLEDLKRNVREGLQAEKERNLAEKRRLDFLDRVAEGLGEIEIPDALVNSQVEGNVNQIKKMAEDMKLTFEDYLNLAKKDEKTLREELARQAERFIIHSLIMRKIAQENNIQAKEEEISEYSQKLISQYPSETVKKISPKDLYEISKERLVFAKSFSFLEELAKKEPKA